MGALGYPVDGTIVREGVLPRKMDCGNAETRDAQATSRIALVLEVSNRDARLRLVFELLVRENPSAIGEGSHRHATTRDE